MFLCFSIKISLFAASNSCTITWTQPKLHKNYNKSAIWPSVIKFQVNFWKETFAIFKLNADKFLLDYIFSFTCWDFIGVPKSLSRNDGLVLGGSGGFLVCCKLGSPWAEKTNSELMFTSFRNINWLRVKFSFFFSFCYNGVKLFYKSFNLTFYIFK